MRCKVIAEISIPVRYAETDKMGVVYHANYLIWFEIARTHFLDVIGYSYARIENEGYMAPVLSAELNYGSPLHYGESAVVTCRLIELSGVKTVFSYEVWREGQDRQTEKPSCTGRTTHCLVKEDSFKPISIKRKTPDLYEAYQNALES